MARRELSETAPARRLQPRGVATRERLLTAARGLLARHGYEGTSIGDVARDAGVGVGTVYHHFADKRALLLELLDRQVAAGSIELVDSAGGPMARAFRSSDVRGVLAEGVRLSRDIRRERPGIYVIALDLARRDPEVASRCEAIEAGFLRATRADIASGQEVGRVRSDIDLDAAALTVFNAFDGVIQMLTDEPDRPEADRVIDEFVEMLCRYLLDD